MENKLIMWDIDGTLMHCGSNGTMALNKTFRDIYGIENAFERAAIGRALDSAILSSIMENFCISDSDRNIIIERYIGNLEMILKSNEEKRIMPGVLELLVYIDKHPTLFNSILTSNFRKGAMMKLGSVNILNYFNTGGYGDVSGEKWDAALQGLDEAQRYYGISFKYEHVYIIGDSGYDIECAKKLGMSSIGVATGWTDYETLKKHEPDHLFRDLSDYEKIISILGSNE